MESFKLNAYLSGLLSVLLGAAPNLAQLTSWADLFLKLASLASVLLIIYRNLKKPNVTS